MALPSSGTLKFSDIKTEFGGGSPPANFRAYLKGAGYVSVSDTAPNVPSSGSMKIRDFLGAAKASAPLSAYASPASVSGSGDGSGPQTVNSDTVTIVASGGTAPYSYAWALQSGTTMTGHASGATNYWSKNVLVDQVVTATYRCTVTDSASGSVTVDVAVTLDNFA